MDAVGGAGSSRLEAASRAEEVRVSRGRLRRVLNRQREPLDLWFSENHRGRRLAYIDEAATRQRLLPLVPLFAGLQDFEVEQLAEAFSTQDFEEGETIIRQGDDGDKFYLLEEGSAAVRVAPAPGEPEREVHRYAKGGFFGERALLTDEPRGASVVAAERCRCSFLLKERFRDLLATHAALRARLEDAMEKYQLQPPQVSTAEFLATVPLFAGLEDAERADVAALMKTQTYREGEFVIAQGDTGDSMYVLLEGAASVTIRLTGAGEDAEAKTVHRYAPGGFFGERALLVGEPRAASVIAVEPAKCAALAKADFAKLLRENAEMRTKVEEQMLKYSKRKDIQKKAPSHEHAAAEKAQVAGALRATAYIEYTEEEKARERDARQRAAGGEVALEPCYSAPYGTPTVFVTAPPREFLCPVCQDVFFDPRIASDGGLYCAACIPATDSQGQAVTSVGRDEFLWNKIMSLKILCRNGLAPLGDGSGDFEYDPDGCKVAVELAAREDHERACGYEIVRCGLPGSLHDIDNCGERVRKIELLAHRRTCIHRLARCGNEGCGRSVQVRLLRAHEAACPRRRVECACGWSGPHVEHLEHQLADCPKYPVVCGLEDTEDPAGACGHRCAREEMRGPAGHEAACPYRALRCRNCGLYVSAFRMAEHLRESCPFGQRECDRCGAQVLRRMWAAHRAENCALGGLADCPFAPYGCEARIAAGAPSELRAHLAEAAPVHLRLLLDSVTAGQATVRAMYGRTPGMMEALEARVQASEADCARMAGALGALARAASGDSAEVSARVEGLRGALREQRAAVGEAMRKALADAAARLGQAREEYGLLEALVATRLSREAAGGRLARVRALGAEARDAHERALRELGEQDELLGLELARARRRSAPEEAAAGALAEARGHLRDLRWADERQVQALDAGEREWSRRAETAVNELVGRGLVQESRLRAVRRRAEGGAASRDLGHRDAVGRTARSLGKVRGERALRRQEERGGGS